MPKPPDWRDVKVAEAWAALAAASLSPQVVGSPYAGSGGTSMYFDEEGFFHSLPATPKPRRAGRRHPAMQRLREFGRWSLEQLQSQLRKEFIDTAKFMWNNRAGEPEFVSQPYPDFDAHQQQIYQDEFSRAQQMGFTDRMNAFGDYMDETGRMIDQWASDVDLYLDQWVDYIWNEPMILPPSLQDLYTLAPDSAYPDYTVHVPRPTWPPTRTFP